MDLWLWSLCFLPVAGALRILPEVKMEGMLGGSITIECPLPQMHVRLYLCREIAESGVCATVVSNKNFVKEEYKHRVTLKPCPDRKLFLVEVTELTKSDSGIYACGTGMNTDRGKTQQVTLSVHSEYDLFWEEEPMPEPPSWFHKFLHMPMPPWFKMPPPPSSFEFIPKVVTPAPRTEAPPAVHSSPPIPISHHLRVSRASSVAASKPPTLLPSTIASKTSAPEALPRPQTASYNYHTRLHRQRAFHQDPVPGLEDQGFHILVPTTLALILLALLGLLMKRVIQRRKGERLRARGGRGARRKGPEHSDSAGPPPPPCRGHSGASAEQPGAGGTWEGVRDLEMGARRAPGSAGLQRAAGLALHPPSTSSADPAGPGREPRGRARWPRAPDAVLLSPRLPGAALSRRARRAAVRMRALEASQRPPPHRPRGSQPPRSQNNIYTACPRRARAADAEGVPPLPGSRPSAPPVAPQASEVLWLHAPSLKTSCDYVSCYREPAANAEDTDSDDYVNIPYLTHLSSCPPGPRPWCQ
uniref:Immunoglobulin V-set domain-containing protein n=1 Tax=Canis lupus familiaris TaxID=9615 RepID=A0A8C0P0G2_CANLF